MSKLLFLFVDGVGLGSADPSVNPFAAARTPFLRELLGGSLTLDHLAGSGGEISNRRGPSPLLLRGIDATLGVEGLPQSATGQATLLTGENCSLLMNGHYGPWPGPTIKGRLGEGNLFSEVRSRGLRARLANAYPRQYFEAVAARRARMNVPVFCAYQAGVKIPDLNDYAAGRGVAADLTGAAFAAMEPDLPGFPAREMGSRLSGLAAGADFTFFDLWPTDRLGHRGTMAEAVSFAESFDEFLAGVVGSLGDTTLLLTSDHGNFEDKSTRVHTRAPVPLLAAGSGAQAFAGVRSLLDVYEASLGLITS